MKHLLSRGLNAVSLAVLASCAALAPPAQAAYVVVIADPLFGVTYPGQGWAAQAALYIPDACYASASAASAGGTFFQLNLGGATVPGCGGGTFGSRSEVKMTDVKVRLYNNVPTNVFDTVAIAPYLAETPPEAAGGHSALSRLIDIGFINGAVVSFHTTLSVAKPSNVPLLGDTSSQLQLQFSKDAVIPSFADGLANTVNCGATVAGNGSILCVTGVRPGGNVVLGSVAPIIQIGPVLTDEEYAALQVPEPATRALFAAAMAAGLLAHHRRRRRLAGPHTRLADAADADRADPTSKH